MNGEVRRLGKGKGDDEGGRYERRGERFWGELRQKKSSINKKKKEIVTELSCENLFNKYWVTYNREDSMKNCAISEMSYTSVCPLVTDRLMVFLYGVRSYGR